MRREAVLQLIFDTSLAELRSRSPRGDRDAVWLREAGLAIDNLNLAAGLLQHARERTAEVANATTAATRRMAEAKVDLVRDRAWRAAASVVASLLVALADHPFTAERSDYPALRN